MLTSVQLSAQDEYRYVVTGRAVNASGRPVPYAHFVIGGISTDRGGDFGYTGDADADGRFRIEVSDSSMLTTARDLWISGPRLLNTVRLIEPPFKELPEQPATIVRGQRIQIIKNGEVDVGDLPAKVFYKRVTVALRDRYDRRLLMTPAAWEGVLVRIEDSKGRFIVETAARGREGDPLNFVESSVDLALPPGDWKVLVGLPKVKKWFLASDIVRVTSESRDCTIVINAN